MRVILHCATSPGRWRHRTAPMGSATFVRGCSGNGPRTRVYPYLILVFTILIQGARRSSALPTSLYLCLIFVNDRCWQPTLLNSASLRKFALNNNNNNKKKKKRIQNKEGSLTDTAVQDAFVLRLSVDSVRPPGASCQDANVSVICGPRHGGSILLSPFICGPQGTTSFHPLSMDPPATSFHSLFYLKMSRSWNSKISKMQQWRQRPRMETSPWRRSRLQPTLKGLAWVLCPVLFLLPLVDLPLFLSLMLSF